jgi:hypothetical protein
MQINKYLMPITVIVALLGTISAARIAGYWQTSGRDMIDPNKPMTSADIRGWMPLEHLSEHMDIPHEELCTLLGIPTSTPPHTPLKELEGVIEVSQVRVILAEYVGHTAIEPQELKAVTPSPTATTATTAPTKPESEHEPGSGQGTGDGSGPGSTPLPQGQVLPAAEIKGRMTLQQVSDQCGIPLSTLYKELGLSDSMSSTVPLRDLKNQIDGFEVSLVRDVVAANQAK